MAANKIYSAVYSGVPVYEMIAKGIAVMRRRSDSFMNATQILKVAGIEKGKRTKILEKEVHPGEHEKVQGGYGKYQGTWIPLQRSKEFAERCGVYDELRPLLEFALPFGVDEGDFIPTKEQAIAAKRKEQLKIADGRPPTRKTPPPPSPHHDLESPSKSHRTRSQHPPSRIPHQLIDEHPHKKQKTDTHTILAAIFKGDNSDQTLSLLRNPGGAIHDIGQVIDDDGNGVLHWTSALARVKTVDQLVANGADVRQRNYAGETPLMHAVMVPNNFEADCFQKTLSALQNTIPAVDAKGRTVLHHTALTTGVTNRTKAALYYMGTLLDVIGNNKAVIDTKDAQGDTALSISAKLECSEMVDMLKRAGANADLENQIGLTAMDYQKAEILEQDLEPEPSDTASTSESQREKRVHGPSQRGRQIVATVQKIVEALDEEYGSQISTRETELQRLRSDIKHIEEELETARKTLEERQSRSQYFSETQQRIKNLEAAIKSGWSELASLAPSDNVPNQEALNNYDENEDIDTQFDISLSEGNSSAQAHQLHARIQAYTKNNDNLQRQISKLQAEMDDKELQCKRLIAACCNLPVDKIDDLVEPLTLAIESDPPDLDLDRVIGFMEKIRRQGSFGESAPISPSGHREDAENWVSH